MAVYLYPPVAKDGSMPQVPLMLRAACWQSADWNSSVEVRRSVAVMGNIGAVLVR